MQSLAVRVLAYVTPVAIAVPAGLWALWTLDARGGPVGLGTLVLVVAAVCALALLLFSLWAERCLTLAALLDISMWFPYRPSSRLSIAMRTGSHRQLLAELDKVRDALAWADAPSGTAAVRDAELRLDRVESVLTLVAVLSTLEPGMRDHSERVGRLADRLATHLDLDTEEREKLRWAALVHDIGKLTVPPEILNKPGPLTADEWSVIYWHPMAGARIVQPLEGWLGGWSRAVLEHHERWDGSGYPNGLAGDQISLAARIVAVADSYQVMTSSRVYKQRLSSAAARRELQRNAGSQFDPAVVSSFLSMTGGSGRPAQRIRGRASRLPLVAGIAAAIAAVPGSAAAVTVAAMGVMAAVTLGPSVIGPDAAQTATSTATDRPQATQGSPASTGPAPAVSSAPTAAPAVRDDRASSQAPEMPAPAGTTPGTAAISLSPDQVISEGGAAFGGGSFVGAGNGWVATVDYGDGSGPGALPLYGQSFQLSHVYGEEGAFLVRVQVINAALQASQATMRVTVTDHPIAVSLPLAAIYSPSSGQPFAVTGSFADPTPDVWSGTATVDGAPQALPLFGHGFTVVSPFSTIGLHTIRVTVTDQHGSTGVAVMTVTVLL